MIILSRDHKPFKTKNAALATAARKDLKVYELVTFEDGFGLKVPDDPKVNKHAVTESWKPATMLNIPEDLKDPNFVYRFCTKNREGNIQKKLAEGWVVDTELTKKMKERNLIPTMDDGKQTDTTLQIREMIVMKLPVQKAEARRKYYADRSASRTKRDAERRFREEVTKITGNPDSVHGAVELEKEYSEV